ncbi:MAG: ribosome biogenesis GTP-binding protein YihA/YsxC [Eubacteriales bacterium]
MAVNIQNSKLEITAGHIDQFPSRAIPQIVFSGRSNVGKSSLINTMLGRKSLTRVSSAPGKTITVNFYNVDNKIMLVDLPGYGFAKRPESERRKWSALTDGYFTSNPNIDRLCLAVQLVDLEVGPTADDVMMINYLTQTGIPFVIVASKADKPNKTNRAKALELLASHEAIPEGTPIIPFSSKSGEGKEQLWKVFFAATDKK